MVEEVIEGWGGEEIVVEVYRSDSDCVYVVWWCVVKEVFVVINVGVNLGFGDFEGVGGDVGFEFFDDRVNCC